MVAANWFLYREIEIWTVYKNPPQEFWSKSLKAYAPVFIDDAALGCPLILSPDGNRPFADWTQIERLLKEIDYL